MFWSSLTRRNALGADLHIPVPTIRAAEIFLVRQMLTINTL